MGSYAYQQEAMTGYGAPYATDTSPRHGRRASNLGGGALHAEYQQQCGGQYGGVYGAPQLLSKGAVEYGAEQYGRNESFGRVTTHWTQAAPYAPGAMYHPPPSPAPLPASEFDDPQGIMKGRMRSHAALEGAAAGLHWDLPSTRPRGQSVPVSPITGEPLQHAAAGRSPAGSNHSSRRTSSSVAAAPPGAGARAPPAAGGYSAMYSQQHARRASEERLAAGPAVPAGRPRLGSSSGTAAAGASYSRQAMGGGGGSAAGSTRPMNSAGAEDGGYYDAMAEPQAGDGGAGGKGIQLQWNVGPPRAAPGSPASRGTAAGPAARPRVGSSAGAAAPAGRRQQPPAAAAASRPPWSDTFEPDADAMDYAAPGSLAPGAARGRPAQQGPAGGPGAVWPPSSGSRGGSGSSYEDAGYSDVDTRATSAPGAPRATGLQRLKELASQRLVQRLHSPSSTTSSEPLDGYAPSPAARPVRQLQQPGKAQPAQRPEWLDDEPVQQRPGPGRARPAASTSSRPQWRDPDVVEDEPPTQPAAARARAQPPTALSKKPAPAPSQWHDEEPPYQPPARAAPRQAPSPAPAPAKPGFLSALFGGASSQPAAGLPDESAGADLPKVQCTSCGRSFIESAYERHSRICEKVFVQKRKAFDMSSKRQEGLEFPAGSGAGGGRGGGRAGGAGAGRKPGAAQTRRPVSHEDRPAQGAAAKMPKWKQQSEQLKAAMRANKQIAAAQARGEDIRTLKIDTGPELPDDRVPCPHCGRRYAPDVADRHIPKCKDIVAKPGMQRANAGRGAYARGKR